MKLINIEIKNFGPFQEANFEFKNGNIFPIVALNNAGKTSLLNAVKWCLYGNLKVGKGKHSRILNDATRINSKGEELEVSVKLTFEKNNKKYPQIERTIKYLSDSKNRYASFGNDEIIFIEATKEGSKRHTFQEATHKINELLPEEVSDFFLMDGEVLEDKLRKNSSKESKTQIKESIEQLCRLDEYDEIIDDLEIIYNKIHKQIMSNSDSSDMKSLGAELEEYKKIIELKNKERTEILNNRDEVKAKLSELSKRLSESDEKFILNLESNRKKLLAELKSLNKEISDDLVLEQKTNVELMFYNITEKHRTKLEKDIDHIQKSENYPPAIDHNILKKIISDKLCICGQKCTDLKKIKKLLEGEDYSPLEDFVKNGYRNMDLIKSTVDTLNRELGILSEKIQSAENRKNKVTKDINEIDNKLRSSDKLDIKELSKKRSELENKEEELIKEEGNIDYQIGLIKDEINELDSRIKNMISTEDKLRLMNNQKELVSDTITTLKIIRSEILNEVKDKLIVDINSAFKKLHHEGKSYAVSIDNRFVFSISKKTSGEDYTNEISSGSALLFGYALMTSLKMNTGFNFPIIVDSPLGKLDHLNRKNVINEVPKILGNKQIIFLFTSGEYDSEIEKVMKKQKMGNNLKIKGYPDKHYSEVIYDK